MVARTQRGTHAHTLVQARTEAQRVHTAYAWSEPRAARTHARSDARTHTLVQARTEAQRVYTAYAWSEPRAARTHPRSGNTHTSERSSCARQDNRPDPQYAPAASAALPVGRKPRARAMKWPGVALALPPQRLLFGTSIACEVCEIDAVLIGLLKLNSFVYPQGPLSRIFVDFCHFFVFLVYICTPRSYSVFRVQSIFDSWKFGRPKNNEIKCFGNDFRTN